MTDAELERAMRLGESSPNDARRESDLGRFGLGLKTASFSQCRSLTVVSRKDGRSLLPEGGILTFWRRVPVTSGGLLEGPGPGAPDIVQSLQGNGTATLVLWEKLDRIVGPGATQQDFLDLIDGVERHLAMVFHRVPRWDPPSTDAASQ